MTGIRVRLTRADDADQFPEIERSAGAIFRTVPELAWLADGIVTPVKTHQRLAQAETSWLAEDPSIGVVGFLAAEAFGDALHLWELAVREDQQRRGIGTLLMGAAHIDAARRGLRWATLTTFRDLPWNGPYYERLGFLILSPDELDDRLRSILAGEVEHGLPGSRRCAMRLAFPPAA